MWYVWWQLLPLWERDAISLDFIWYVPSHLCKVLTPLIVDRIYFNVVVVCDGEVGLTTGETIVWFVGSMMTWPKFS